MKATVFAPFAALLGCSATPPLADAAVDARPYELTIARPDPSGYAPFEPDAGIEIRLGFQGFRYTRVVLVARGDVPPSTPGRARFDIEGFDPAELRVNAVNFQWRTSGEYVSAPLLVFANDVSPQRAAGHRATITIDLDDRRTRATATVTGVVRWDPNCVEDANGNCGPPAATDGGAP